MGFGVGPSIETPRAKRVVNLFPDTLGVLVSGITDAIYGSFDNHPMPIHRDDNDSEKRRRFAICMDWAVILRGDCKWGVQRIVDAMPEILNTELSGTKYEPSKRQCWIPADGK